MLTSIKCANDFVLVSKKKKIGNCWENVDVKQPRSVHNYSQYMNGVDRSDQLMTRNNELQKCMRWWKVLFFHMIDIAAVNSSFSFNYTGRKS